jgi:hypothetical protein
MGNFANINVIVMSQKGKYYVLYPEILFCVLRSHENFEVILSAYFLFSLLCIYSPRYAKYVNWQSLKNAFSTHMELTCMY